MIDDEEPVTDDLEGFKVLKADVPPLRADVAYRLDQASQEQALHVRRLNELGSIGVLETRAAYTDLVAKRAKAELEIARMTDANPWLIQPLQPARPALSWRSKASLAFAALLVVAVGAAALARPTPPRAAGEPESAPSAAVSGGISEGQGGP